MNTTKTYGISEELHSRLKKKAKEEQLSKSELFRKALLSSKFINEQSQAIADSINNKLEEK